MKCKWYERFEGTCTNDACPYCGDACRMDDHQEVCRFAEEARKTETPTLTAEELVKSLRVCATHDCIGCTLQMLDEELSCTDVLNLQAADMLEELAKGDKGRG